jgi:hypothetical protein
VIKPQRNEKESRTVNTSEGCVGADWEYRDIADNRNVLFLKSGKRYRIVGVILVFVYFYRLYILA